VDGAGNRPVIIGLRRADSATQEVPLRASDMLHAALHFGEMAKIRLLISDLTPRDQA
jgi:hypothetical protein